MKKLSTLLLLSLTAMFIFSCQKAESPVTDPTEGTITTLTVAPPVPDADTKVSFDDDTDVGMKLTWEAEDVITIYDNAGDRVGNFKCTAVVEEGEKEGEAAFEAVAGSGPANGNPVLVDNDTYQAVYPASTKGNVSERDAAIATTLADQQQSANDLTHLDKYLFMKDAAFIAGTTDKIDFTYEVSTYVLEFPWTTAAPTSVEFKDVKIDGTSRTPIKYKLSKSDGFAISDSKVKIYFMIAANNPAEYRGVSFTIENGNSADKKVFTTPATAIAYAAGKTYRGTIPTDGYDEATDYIDEYGANHGQGTAVSGSTIKWAPVNLGYQKAIAEGHKGFPYGKLYQWGRKDGQGYMKAPYEDAEYPADATTTDPLGYGLTPNALKFYEGNDASSYQWMSKNGSNPAFNDTDKWNDTDLAGRAGVGNPCPSGWRVPIKAELDVLCIHQSKWDTTEKGRWFAGSVDVADDNSNAVFFPAAGYRGFNGGAGNRGSHGRYWSSTPTGADAYYLSFYGGDAGVYGYSRANGYSVRCVQD